MNAIEWRPVPGLEDRYEVSRDGRVRTQPKVLKPYPSKNRGHLQINLGLHRRSYVHRLVAEAFLPNPEGKRVVNHKNGNPADNRVANLEWATHAENNLHGWRSNGRVATHAKAVSCYGSDGKLVATYASAAAAAKVIGVQRASIYGAIRRKGTCGGMTWCRT